MIAAVTLTLILPIRGYCVFGVGDLVSDLKAYTYYVEQIKIAQEEYDKMLEELKVAEDTLAETQKMRSLLEGTYNHAVKTISELKKARQALKDDPSVLLEYAEMFLLTEAGEGEEWINAQDIISEVFKDPRKMAKSQIERLKELAEKFHVRQKKLEDAIIKAEKTNESMPDRYEAIEEIAKKIDTTENTKSAVDLSNQLLTEILKAINELISLTAHIGEAQMLVNFEGAEDEVLKQMEQDKAENEKLMDGYSPMQDYLDSKGLGDPDMSREQTRDQIKRNRKKI